MKINSYKKFLTRLTASVLLFIYCSLSSQVVSAQAFSSVDSDLQALENFYTDWDSGGGPD